MPFPSFPCNRVAAGRTPDRDVDEFFNKPAGNYFVELVELEFEAGTISRSDYNFIRRRADELYLFDPRLFTHCCAVAIIAYLLAGMCEEPVHTKVKAFVCGFLHDIGKMRVDRNILWASKDAWEENGPMFREEVSKHAWYGYAYLRRKRGLSILEECALVALLHHKEQDFSYPSDQEIEEGNVPMHLVTDEVRRIIDYVTAADISEASRRKDTLTRDYAEHGNELIRELEIEGLKQRRPDLADKFDLIFDGIIR